MLKMVEVTSGKPQEKDVELTERKLKSAVNTYITSSKSVLGTGALACIPISKLSNLMAKAGIKGNAVDYVAKLYPGYIVWEKGTKLVMVKTAVVEKAATVTPNSIFG